MKKFESIDSTNNNVLEILSKCIEKINDNDNVYADYTSLELFEFIDTLPMDAMVKIREFFETMPSLEHTTIIKNKEGKK